MKKYNFLIFTLSLFFSCENMETVVDLEIPESQPVLVLNSLLDTDRPIQVLISHSVGAFSQNIPTCINDADVMLYENNIFLDTLKINLDSTMYHYFYHDGGFDSIPMHYYESNIIPNKDSNYRIDASHDNYPSISATTYIPNDIEIYDVQIDTLTHEDQIGFNFSFLDNPNMDNYYRLKLYSSCTKEWVDELTGEMQSYSFNGYVEMMSNDPSFPGGLPWNGYTFVGNKVVFSDALFNGEEKNIRLDIESSFRYENCDTIRLQFSVFSADTYSYYNSLTDHRGNGALSIFGGEVIPVYSNVENGLGSLISTNAQIIQIKP